MQNGFFLPNTILAANQIFRIDKVGTDFKGYLFVLREVLVSVFAFFVSHAVWFTLNAPKGAPLKTDKMRPSWSAH